MNITLVRSATLILETAAGRLLVDPMLDPAGPGRRSRTPRTRPQPDRGAARAGRGGRARGLDAVLVTHLSRGHLDGTAGAA
jgi:L-ascorbate metabolism protein UlaG (beta-lactamase superfamily)